MDVDRSPTILIVDDEPAVLAHTEELLASMRIGAATAGSITEALQVISASCIDAALIDWRLAGREDGLAFGRMLLRDRGLPFVLFSGYLDADVISYAFRQGAADVLEKPLRVERVASALEFALSIRSKSAYASFPLDAAGADSIIEDWALLVMKAVRCAKDPKTEEAVAYAAGQSETGLRTTCAGCNVSTRHTRDLIRFLRAISRSNEDGSYVRSHLSIKDPRTRARLFQRAGLRLDARRVDLKAFLTGQHFVPTSHDCFRALSHRAANDPLFFARIEH